VPLQRLQAPAGTGLCRARSDRRGEIEESRLLNYFKLKEEVAAAAAKLAVRQAETAQERGGKKGKGQQFRPAGKPRRR
jgi:ribosome biogenesis GTPase